MSFWVVLVGLGLLVTGMGLEGWGVPLAAGLRNSRSRRRARRYPVTKLLRLLGPVRQRRKAQQVESQLPLLVEALVLGGQGGLGLRESLALAAESLPEPLAGEIVSILSPVAVGQSLRQALEQHQLQATGALQTLLEQLLAGEELGVSLEDILTRQAEAQTQAQMQIQESRINSLSLTTSVVALLFLFPPLVVLVLVPNLILFLASW